MLPILISILALWNWFVVVVWCVGLIWVCIVGLWVVGSLLFAVFWVSWLVFMVSYNLIFGVYLLFQFWLFGILRVEFVLVNFIDLVGVGELRSSGYWLLSSQI